MDHTVTWDADCYRMVILLNAPVQHRKIFLAGCRCQIDQIRDIGHHRDIVNSQMRHIVHSIYGSCVDQKGHRIIVHAEIL